MNNPPAIIDYLHWKDEYKSILKSFRDKKIIYSFSGGKDSSLALDFMLRAGKDFSFDFESHAAAFPVHRYKDTETKRLGDYWKKRGVDIIWHDSLGSDEQIRNRKNPCDPCQKIRKNLLKTIVEKGAYYLNDLVLIVNYSLWDIVGYSIEHILSDLFSSSKEIKGTKKSKRFIETAQRFYPLLRMREGYTVFRPLIKYNGSDILFTLREAGIPILSIPCAYRDFRPKKLLEGYYEKMGLHFDYKSVFDFAREALDLPDISSYESMKKERYLADIF